MRANPSRRQPRAEVEAAVMILKVDMRMQLKEKKETIQEGTRNDTNKTSCFVGLRVASCIVSFPYAAQRSKHIAVFLVVFLFLNAPFNSRGQRSNEAVKPGVTFVEVPAKTSGIGWVHTNAHSPERFLPETVGAGGAFLDYDNDGWMDIYLVNSGPADFYTPPSPLKNALYRNNRDGTFTDVTDKAGVAGGRFGMGAAAGDYDGDGSARPFRH